ncbi:MAG: hypothetical protein LM564_04800 [Desulfurococcaceae archaeon]|nr:hypothetical protein [Desulfurococcaceae archaeon]
MPVDPVDDIVGNYLPALYILASLVALATIYYASKAFLARLRLRGIISRRSEETAKLVILAIATVIIIPAALSAVTPHPLVPAVSIAVALLVVAVVLFSIIGYIANSLSYLIVATTSIVRDGELVRVELDGREYEGRALLSEGNYMVLKTESGASVLIPYSRLLKSVIVKLSQVPIVLRVEVESPRGSLDEVIRKVTNVVRSSKLIDRSSVSVKPLEVSEDKLVLLVEAEAANPRNVSECYDELVKALIREIPYKVSVEVVERRNIP